MIRVLVIRGTQMIVMNQMKIVYPSSTMISNSFDQYPDYVLSHILYSMTCRQGFIHSYAYFEILSMKRCIHCGKESP